MLGRVEENGTNLRVDAAGSGAARFAKEPERQPDEPNPIRKMLVLAGRT